MFEFEPTQLSPRELLNTLYNSSYPNLVRLEVDTLADNPLDIHQEAIRRLQLQGDETVMDLGCNDGRTLAHLRNNGHQGVLIGVDPAEDALAAGEFMFGGKELQAKDSLKHGYAEDLPLPTDSVDKVIATRVLDHVDDITESLWELMRVTRPGGLIAVTTSGADNKRGTHEQASLIADYLDVVGRTSLTNGFTSEVAEPALREVFKNVEVLHHTSPIRLRHPLAGNEDQRADNFRRLTVHRTGQESYHATYVYQPGDLPHLTPVSLKDWQKAYDQVVWPAMEKTMQDEGEWQDLVHRSVFLCRNPERSRRARPADRTIGEIALFDQHRTLRHGYDVFDIYNAMAADGLITTAANERVQEVFARHNDKLIEFEQFVVDTMYVAAAALKGRRVDAAQRITELYLAETDEAWFGYVKPLLAEAKSAGVKTALITAAPQFMADVSGSILGMNYSYGSQFGIGPNGLFTGTVRHILGGAKKAEIAGKLTKRAARSSGFGDSTGDLGMLMKVDRPYAVNPTDELRRFAAEADWPIIEDPDQLLSTIKFG